jgi:hypothetical protein
MSMLRHGAMEVQCRSGGRRPLILASLVAVAALALLAAGCGGGGSPRVASVASSTTVAATTAQNGGVAFTRCMRSNGVPNLPDPPTVGARTPKLTLQQLGVSDSQFETAKRACNHLLPNGGSGPQETAQQKRTRLADALSFARCMRSHGVTRFPDPTAQGDLSVEMVQAQGIDVHSPAVLRSVQACLPASHGALTPAKVRAALNNAGG